MDLWEEEREKRELLAAVAGNWHRVAELLKGFEREKQAANETHKKLAKKATKYQEDQAKKAREDRRK